MSLLEATDQVTFDTLVGDGKRYKDPDAAAKALVEKDRFIEQLKQEKAEALRDLQARQPVVDRSAEILQKIEEIAKRPATTIEDTTPPERDGKNLTEDDIVRVLAKREQEARATANLNKAKA